jgi:Protein of unknown function (DUF4239)
MMYWVYDISNFNFACLTVTAFIAFGVGGLLLSRWFLGRRSSHVLETNEIVGFYFSAIVGFYGITLGLISVGVWQTFSDADNKSTLEAASIEGLYRDFSGYPEPTKTALQNSLKDYTKNVIEVAWPMQRQGLTPKGGTELMTALQKILYPFEPQTQSQIAIHREALHQYNQLSERRRLRVLSATSGLPGTTWWVVIIGAAASILLTWLFSVENVRRHIFLTGLYSGLIGLLIFLIAALDNPYRGEFSVGPEAFELVMDRMSKM